MAMSIVMIVLILVVAGIGVRSALARVVDSMLPVLSWVSVLGVAAIVAIVVSGSADRIIHAGLLVLLAVAIHHVLGYIIGYLIGRVTGQPFPVRRSTAIEVGMQNSGLAAGLAEQYMSPIAALPGAVFSVWHNLSGAVFALLCRHADARADARSSATD